MGILWWVFAFVSLVFNETGTSIPLFLHQKWKVMLLCSKYFSIKYLSFENVLRAHLHKYVLI